MVYLSKMCKIKSDKNKPSSHLNSMEKNIPNPYFSVELSEVQVNYIREMALKILEKDLQKTVQVLPNPHISVSYLLGNVDLNEIEKVAEEIVEAPFKMNVIGFDSVESSYYGGTIIAIALNHSDDFLYSQDLLKEVLCSEEVKVKQYKGGFRAHLSLFLLKDLTESEKALLPRYLELVFNQNPHKEITGEKFCMYNPDRVKIIEKNFKG